ncbi:hypothetical protein D3C76_1171600 [compost metagenome]
MQGNGATHLHGVGELRRNPYTALGRNDPVAVIGKHGDDPACGISELTTWMVMHWEQRCVGVAMFGHDGIARCVLVGM